MSNDRHKWESRHGATDHSHATASLLLQRWADVLHGRVLDLAAGGGRNTLLLARRGRRVDAIDIAAAALRNIQSVAAAEHLHVGCIQADLTSFPLPTAAYDGIINIRYLQRSLFSSIRRCLRPGGVLLFETFLVDQRTIGHPRNPQFLLERGELRHAFPGFEILYYFEGRVDTESDAAFLAQLVARQPLG